MPQLFLPRAKYLDSVIIRKHDTLFEILVNEVRGHFVDGELFWVYYPTGKSGETDILHDMDILMNLTTGTIYEEELENVQVVQGEQPFTSIIN